MEKKSFILIVFILLAIITRAQVGVKGYYRKNGSYVQPHMRSNPDKSPFNNYSYPGNTNPYTGKVATGDEQSYLNRYYSTGGTVGNYNTSYSSQSQSVAERVNQNEKIKINSGYMIILNRSPKSTLYKTFDLNNINTGFITELYNKDLYVYDVHYNLIEKISNANKNKYIPVPSQSPLAAERINQNDKIKTQSGYLIILNKSAKSTLYKIFNLNNISTGFITELYDNDLFVYDTSYNLIEKVSQANRSKYIPSPAPPLILENVNQNDKIKIQSGYMIILNKSSESTLYKTFDLDNIHTGFITELRNKDLYIYDTRYNLIKNISGESIK